MLGSISFALTVSVQPVTSPALDSCATITYEERIPRAITSLRSRRPSPRATGIAAPREPKKLGARDAPGARKLSLLRSALTSGVPARTRESFLAAVVVPTGQAVSPGRPVRKYCTQFGRFGRLHLLYPPCEYLSIARKGVRAAVFVVPCGGREAGCWAVVLADSRFSRGALRGCAATAGFAPCRGSSTLMRALQRRIAPFQEGQRLSREGGHPRSGLSCHWSVKPTQGRSPGTFEP